MMRTFSNMKRAGVDKALASLGLDFDSFFPRNREEAVEIAYGGHEWIVKTVERFGVIVNAVPPDDRLAELPWEEWFVLDGKPRHHVLHLSAPPAHDEIFEAPEADDIHPPRTLGRKWYVVDDHDMTPVLLRAGRKP